MKTYSIIILFLISFNTVRGQEHIDNDTFNLQEGVYAAYYLHEKESDSFKPDYQVFYKSGQGFYWSTDIKTKFPLLEYYTWTIDKGALKFINHKSIYIDDNDCEVVKYTFRRWKIINQKEDIMHLKLYYEEIDGHAFNHRLENSKTFVLKRIGDLN